MKLWGGNHRALVGVNEEGLKMDLKMTKISQPFP